MHDDAAGLAVDSQGHRHLERLAPVRADPPERRGAGVTERCVGTAAEHGGHELPMPRQVRPPYGVHAASHAVEAAALDAVPDRVVVEAEGEELPRRDDPMLPPGQPPELPD